MLGITTVACHIPRYRLTKGDFAETWGTGARNDKAVANHDEDTITMAAQAVSNAFTQLPETECGCNRFYFASASAPYLEKSSAAVVATACDQPQSCFTVDFGGSPRAVTMALRSALEGLRATGGRAVVAAADLRHGLPGTPEDQSLGEAGAAVVLGEEGVLAEYRGCYSLSEDFTDAWRTANDQFLKFADTRFANEEGYQRLTAAAIKGLVEETGTDLNRVKHAAIYAPDARVLKGILTASGLPSGIACGLEILSRIGNCGNAAPLLYLEEALDRAQPGDLILVAGYGSGADALLFEATSLVGTVRFNLSDELASGRKLKAPGRYLQFRHLVATETISPFSSEIMNWRDQNANLRLHGQRCRKCGAIQYPPRHVCWQCNTRDNLEDCRLGRRGRVFTYTLDTLVPTPDPPVPMVVVDLEAGGRMYAQLTDCDPSEVKLGQELELTFRRLHSGAGFHNYFWKFRPLSGQGGN